MDNLSLFTLTLEPVPANMAEVSVLSLSVSFNVNSSYRSFDLKNLNENYHI